MRTLCKTAMALAIAATLVFAASAARAQAPPQQTTTGTATVVFNQTGPANNAYNGEVGGGNGVANYTVNDPTKAVGNASTTGAATGSNTGPVVSNNKTTVTAGGNSKSVVNGLTTGTGATVNVGVAGAAHQNSWSGTTADPKATTFANVSEVTSGGYNATANGDQTVTQKGAGTAQGQNNVQTINVGGLNVSSTFNALGVANGTVSTTSTDPTNLATNATADVSGALSGNAAALAGNTAKGTWGDAANTGTVTLGGSSPTGTINGAGQVSGANSAGVNTNTPGQVSVSVSSTVSTKGQVK